MLRRLNEWEQQGLKLWDVLTEEAAEERRGESDPEHEERNRHEFLDNP